MEQIAEYVEQITTLQSRLKLFFPNVICVMIAQHVGSKHQESLQELLQLNETVLNRHVEFFEFNFGGAVPLDGICDLVIEEVQPWSDDFEVSPHWTVANMWKFRNDILDSTTRNEKINTLYRCLLYFYDGEFQHNHNVKCQS